ncbi:hypothetical protein [Hymenobacter canadensis]|uniref:Uncharacterized protein n=1 Tax=Hymenobacter canadensis TaxID=2999067 RepID=A0ABY7LK07_9BACT|nr:hypothetical protein [Hymenobacter canadensis]WBA40776.1 hypothetical protein O3303_13205 [Hymenobacter canadensis]
MNATTTLARQMVAVAPAATRHGFCREMQADGRLARFVPGQTDIRPFVAFLVNHDNVI